MSDWKPCVKHLTKRLDALEELVMKQHDIIGILINAGKRLEKEMKENEEED
jgi:hypothetical protein|tara:strand:+ start:1256 stop:1408 length:153 start_codon:yes stop_codon:yes gene_type:complete